MATYYKHANQRWSALNTSGWNREIFHDSSCTRSGQEKSEIRRRRKARMASVLTNGGYLPSKPASAGRHAAVYSEVQTSRLDHELLLPSVLKSPAFTVVDGPPSSAAGNPGQCSYISSTSPIGLSLGNTSGECIFDLLFIYLVSQRHYALCC